MTDIRFDVSEEDAGLICLIVSRAMRHYPDLDEQSLSMDITACHLNGCPLRLEALEMANDFDFIHDVFGIRHHMDRRTGKLMNHFRPRFSVPAREDA